jgi:hypothetical protein
LSVNVKDAAPPKRDAYDPVTDIPDIRFRNY